jgi:hypothetical protein
MAFGAVAAMPGLRCWYLHAQGQRVELLEEFWSLVIMNGFGGSIYATHLLDKAICMDLGLLDISHHVMHVTAVAGAWMYQQGLLAIYETRKAMVVSVSGEDTVRGSEEEKISKETTWCCR